MCGEPGAAARALLGVGGDGSGAKRAPWRARAVLTQREDFGLQRLVAHGSPAAGLRLLAKGSGCCQAELLATGKEFVLRDFAHLALYLQRSQLLNGPRVYGGGLVGPVVA
ncbi:MAG: hypothetical protein EXR48_04370 [Dehalococcoidia bacterium]|nr:hypothetical protein [Dehalococcoidia bacterium]